VGQLLFHCGAELLVIEGLELDTRGKRGGLSRAIESMMDDLCRMSRAVLAVSLVRDKVVHLQVLNPRLSSTLHVGCGGVLKRHAAKGGGWDLAICSRCNQLVNTHLNASFWLEALSWQSDYPRESAKWEELKPWCSSCLSHLGLSYPPYLQSGDHDNPVSNEPSTAAS